VAQDRVDSRVSGHHLTLTAWDRGWATEDDSGVWLIAHLGWFPPARIDVVETDERIVISLYVRWPTSKPGERIAVRALGRTASFKVPLARPVAGRALVDGATGAPPRDWEQPDDVRSSPSVIPVGAEFEYDEVASRPWLPGPEPGSALSQ